jgi:hypothetical protein
VRCGESGAHFKLPGGTALCLIEGHPGQRAVRKEGDFFSNFQMLAFIPDKVVRDWGWLN